MKLQISFEKQSNPLQFSSFIQRTIRLFAFASVLAGTYCSAQDYSGRWYETYEKDIKPNFTVEGGQITYTYCGVYYYSGGWATRTGISSYSRVDIENDSFTAILANSDITISVNGHFVNDNLCTGTVERISGGILLANGDWTATRTPRKLLNPVPTNGATNVDLDQELSWYLSAGAAGYLVDFGTATNPPHVASQTTRTFAPGPLEGNTTYYWRINPTNDVGTTAGDVWNFTTAGVEPAPPELTSIALDEGGVVFQWSSAASYSYTVHESTNLLSGFSEAETGVSATPPVNSYTGTMNGARTKFWKVTGTGD